MGGTHNHKSASRDRDRTPERRSSSKEKDKESQKKDKKKRNNDDKLESDSGHIRTVTVGLNPGDIFLSKNESQRVKSTKAKNCGSKVMKDQIIIYGDEMGPASTAFCRMQGCRRVVI